ncbi:unnamed protein product [Boreogadus saida]
MEPEKYIYKPTKILQKYITSNNNTTQLTSSPLESPPKSMLHECILGRNNSPVNVEFMYARTVCAGPSVAGHVCGILHVIKLSFQLPKASRAHQWAFAGYSSLFGPKHSGRDLWVQAKSLLHGQGAMSSLVQYHLR